MCGSPFLVITSLRMSLELLSEATQAFEKSRSTITKIPIIASFTTCFVLWQLQLGNLFITLRLSQELSQCLVVVLKDHGF
jgi:hypothetical protein